MSDLEDFEKLLSLLKKKVITQKEFDKTKNYILTKEDSSLYKGLFKGLLVISACVLFTSVIVAVISAVAKYVS